MTFVTTMVLVTTSGRSGHASSFSLVRRIGGVVHHQPDQVGVGSTRRMPNKLRKIRTRHRREDRLYGATRQNLRGNHTPTRTTPAFPADRPIHKRLSRFKLARLLTPWDTRAYDASTDNADSLGSVSTCSLIGIKSIHFWEVRVAEACRVYLSAGQKPFRSPTKSQQSS
jgi:hypothetical protein